MENQKYPSKANFNLCISGIWLISTTLQCYNHNYWIAAIFSLCSGLNALSYYLETKSWFKNKKKQKLLKKEQALQAQALAKKQEDDKLRIERMDFMKMASAKVNNKVKYLEKEI